MTDTDTLIARLEAATEGSRELDAEIHKALGWELAPPEAGVAWWNKTGDTYGHRDIPHYTTSLDAALTLVPEGWIQQISGAEDSWGVRLTGNEQNEVIGLAPTPALALCIAAIKAHTER